MCVYIYIYIYIYIYVYAAIIIGVIWEGRKLGNWWLSCSLLKRWVTYFSYNIGLFGVYCLFTLLRRVITVVSMPVTMAVSIALATSPYLSTSHRYSLQQQHDYAILYSTLLYSILLYSTLHYSTVLYSTLLYTSKASRSAIKRMR